MLSKSAVLVSSFSLCLAACGPIGSEGSGPGPSATSTTEDPAPAGTGTGTGMDMLPPTNLDNNGESSGADCPLPALPPFGSLPAIETLPDPFTLSNGTPVATKADWTCRRAEIAALAQEYELGPKPPRPSSVSGALAGDVFTVSVAEADKSVSFDVRINLPPTGTAPYPAVITLGNGTAFNDSQALSSLGVAIINFPNDEVGGQLMVRGQGKFYELYGATHAAGSMMAWAWGVSRVIDALEANADANIDATRLAVTGCSRNGKGALVIGAFDERIVLTMPQESGAGGSASWRVSQMQQNAALAANPNAGFDTQVQTLQSAAGEQPWFRSSFANFGGSVSKLPIDQHLVMGLVAPRALYVADNTWQSWLGNESSFTSASTAHKIWEALGVPDTMSVTQIGDSSHCANVPPRQQQGAVNMVKKFLLGDTSVSTTEVFTDGTFTVDQSRWVDWETPVMQ